MGSGARPAGLGHLPLAVVPVHGTTNNEAEFQRPRALQSPVGRNMIWRMLFSKRRRVRLAPAMADWNHYNPKRSTLHTNDCLNCRGALNVATLTLLNDRRHTLTPMTVTLVLSRLFTNRNRLLEIRLRLFKYIFQIHNVVHPSRAPAGSLKRALWSCLGMTSSSCCGTLTSSTMTTVRPFSHPLLSMGT